MVQLPPAESVVTEKLRAVSPAVKAVGELPVQVLATGPPNALMFTSVSLNASPVSAMTLGLVSVSVTTDVPSVVMLAGLNALLMVGGSAVTSRVAVLLVVPVRA